MAIPTGLPLVGGADPWVLLAPVMALSVAAGWVLAKFDQRLGLGSQDTARVETKRATEEELVPEAA